MKVIYHCYGGSHASPVAAAIHLQQLPTTRIPTVEELRQLKFFDTVPPSFHGTLVHLGRDENGHDIFIIGARNHSQTLLKTLKGVTRIIGENEQNYLFTDVKPCINLIMRLGGFLSREVGLIFPGRPLVTYGVQKAYPKILALVEDTRNRLVRIQAGGA